MPEGFNGSAAALPTGNASGHFGGCCPDSLRAQAREIVEQAARAGIDDAWTILRRTPREIECAFRALEARRRRETEIIDLAAYLVGRYVSIGILAPRRYPSAPDAVQKGVPNMDFRQMKRVFSEMARRRE